jgi:hypothetical protein
MPKDSVITENAKLKKKLRKIKSHMLIIVMLHI